MRSIILGFLLLIFCHLTISKCIHSGECPTYKFRCAIACPTNTKEEMCAQDPLCCIKDSQCARHQKCCAPSCGCYNRCTNVTVVNN
ncbi:unnamed protein product [Adineta steineri]|uniref:WAP domain-containing protein n=1 Tax=Adineta steineri TaxID=433720 RepID=A0A819C3Q1_9BILA|nr:unnamed protein product [Adineta steineri]CAF3878584.1 unnamed protein product [Adineta steineri]CAF4137543.1 unnamed protein product [Adineta steineri]